MRSAPKPTHISVAILMLLTAVMLALTLSGCEIISTGSSDSRDNAADILPTAIISVLPESSDLPQEEFRGENLICLGTTSGSAEQFKIKIDLSNPDRLEILSVKYSLMREGEESSKTEYEVGSENFGTYSDYKTIYINYISLGEVTGTFKLEVEEIKYLYKSQKRPIAGVAGTEFTIKVAPKFTLEMDFAECERDDIETATEINEFSASCKLIADSQMNDVTKYGKAGYIFDGWYTGKDGSGTRYSSTDAYLFYTDMTFYAHYARSIEYQKVTETEENGGEYISVTGLTEEGKRTSFPIEIPAELDGVVVREIADSAFYKAATNRQFILPETLWRIGAKAFAGSTGLTIHMPAVKEIGDYAFDGCGTIVFGKENSSLFPTIGESALPNSLIKIGKYAFRGDGWATNITNPLREGRFKSDSTLVISSTIKYIGDGAFSGNLFKTVYFQEGLELAYLGAETFSNSENLTYLYTAFKFISTGAGHVNYKDAENGLKKISDKMFYNCASLSSKLGAENVLLAEGVKTIGDRAFAGSGEGLKNLLYLTMPDSLESIGEEAFANTGLQNVVFGEGSRLHVLGAYCFKNTKFTEITLYSVKEYKESPFMLNTNLERVNILTDYVPEYSEPSIIGLGRNTKYFVKESMLNSFRNDEKWNPKYSSLTDGWYYKAADYICCYDYITPVTSGVSYCFEPIDDDGNYSADSLNIKITAVFGTADAVTVPANIKLNDKEYTVTAVGKYFVHEKLYRVTLPSTLKLIDSYAFYACTKLHTVSYTHNGKAYTLNAYDEDPLALEYIGDYAFYATALTKFYSNTNLSTIGTGAFRYCTKLGTIVINKGESVTIGISSFSTCGSDVYEGARLAIGNNVKYLGRYAFADNVNLKTIYINLVKVPEAPGGGYTLDSPFNGCNSIEVAYVFSSSALSPTVKGTFMSDKNTDDTNNVYSELKKKDGITSAYELSKELWSDVIKKL